MKKVLSILIVLVIFSGMFISANAVSSEDELQYSGTCGNNLQFDFKETSSTLSISGNGNTMSSYTADSSPWFSFAEKIKKLDLTNAKNLTNFSSYCFAGLKNLTDISYNDTIKTIDTAAFSDTVSLKSFNVKSKVKTINKDAFKNNGIKKIYIKKKKCKLYDLDTTLPKKAVIYTNNPSKAYDYAVKYKRKTYIYLRKLSPESKNEILRIKEKFKCKNVYTPDNTSEKKVKWYSTNKKIAKVNSKGVVTAKKKGICYIYSKSKKSNIKSKKTKIIVTTYNFKKTILKNNNCYKLRRAIVPKGIVVHSTAVNNIHPMSYVRNWNTAKPGGREVCVHGFLGVIDGKINFAQTLPFEMACWGCGGGPNGSYNFYPGYIQFECCEDSTTNPSYFYKIYHAATDLCAYLCLKYNFSYKTVVSHAGAHARGYGSNHGDIDHWLRKNHLTMNDFRKEVKQKIYKIDPKPDLKSGYKNPKVKVIKDTVLRNKCCVDDYGNSVKIKKSLLKGDNVFFVRDDIKSGWSLVKTADGKKGYVRNKFIDLK